jgi:hypothetical protein
MLFNWNQHSHMYMQPSSHSASEFQLRSLWLWHFKAQWQPPRVLVGDCEWQCKTKESYFVAMPWLCEYRIWIYPSDSWVTSVKFVFIASNCRNFAAIMTSSNVALCRWFQHSLCALPFIMRRALPSSICCCSDCDLTQKLLWRNWIETLYDAGSRKRRQSSLPEDLATIILRNQELRRTITTQLRGGAWRRWPANPVISGTALPRLQAPGAPIASTTTGGRPGTASALRQNLWARRQ